MKNEKPTAFDLAAPCGLYCGSCRQYLAKSEGLLKQIGLKQGCDGCRIRNKNCAFIRKGCSALRKQELDFCFECKEFPCDDLTKLDEIYQTRFHTSLIENLKRIEEIGVDKWVKEQTKLFTCHSCGEKTSIHEKKCYFCNEKI